jgi:hypothetical protein
LVFLGADMVTMLVLVLLVLRFVLVLLWEC